MKHEVIDGVDVFSFRQSWLGTWQMCPEQARLEARGELPRVETDATAIGTAVHAAIEAVVGTGASYDDALQIAVLEFARLEALPEFRYVKAMRFQTAEQYVVNCFSSWHEYIYPQLGEPLSIERTFKVPLDERRFAAKGKNDERIMLSGTWDLDDSAWGLVDWKNKGAEIKRWEVDRWGIQPTVYTYAKRYLDELPMTGDMPFTFVNMVKGPRVEPPQVVEVMRNQGHYEWLKVQLWQIVDQYLATNHGTQAWQLNDASWMCSPKWCPAFMNCKGKQVGPNPW